LLSLFLKGGDGGDRKEKGGDELLKVRKRKGRQNKRLRAKVRGWRGWRG
jgi:hypothetical protein